MKKVFKKSAALLGSTLGAMAIVVSAQAATITSVDEALIVTDPAPHTMFELYSSKIFTDYSLSASNGYIGWEESDVQAPGYQVVNGDDVNGTNCIMTSGYNPDDYTNKQCSDSLLSSKRFKLKNDVNAPVDVSYNVVDDGTTGIYKVLQKWTDYTDKRWEAFSIELGFIVNGVFVPSVEDDGLGFSDTRGKYFSRPYTTYQAKEDVLSALFSQGLGGAPDQFHSEPGYFNTTTRMSYGMIATEDSIFSDGISNAYSDVFGEWLNYAGAPIAIFFDDDGDMDTDNALMANCADPANLIHVGTHSGDEHVGFSCDGQWVTFLSEPGIDPTTNLPYISDGIPKPIALTDLAPVVYTNIDAAIASGDPQAMYMDVVEDVANLSPNFWITVKDTDSWPTLDNFTVRYTPVPVEGPPVGEPEICTDGRDNYLDGLIDCDDVVDCGPDPVCDPPAGEICDDGIDNDGDDAIDCADSDCEGSAGPGGGICGRETGADFNCDDGYDNDGDGDVDCADFACATSGFCGATEQFCDDGLDNDFDGATDCDDTDCAGDPACDAAATCSDYLEKTPCRDAGCSWSNKLGICRD